MVAQFVMAAPPNTTVDLRVTCMLLGQCTGRTRRAGAAAARFHLAVDDDSYDDVTTDPFYCWRCCSGDASGTRRECPRVGG